MGGEAFHPFTLPQSMWTKQLLPLGFSDSREWELQSIKHTSSVKVLVSLDFMKRASQKSTALQ